MFYDNVNRICKEKGTTATTVLREIGKSTGNVSKWKGGSIPNLDLALEFAQHIGVSLDYLATGVEPMPSVTSSTLTDEEKEWLTIVRSIPKDKLSMCKDFLNSHAVIPEKYANRKRG